MAEAIEHALANARIVLCEAGTGTGKTLAYLLPALLSRRKIVVSTATRALQEQIFFKDLPLIAEAFGITPRATLMKGISNYVCRRRYAEFSQSPESLRPQYARSLKVVGSWIQETATGDLAELSALPEDDPLRAEIASSSDTRVGPACPYYEECFVTRMRREAEQSDLVVANHHLFFADLVLRGPHPARVLPDYEAVIFDEAHQLEDVATEFFSVRVSSARIERLTMDLSRALDATGGKDPLFSAGSGYGIVTAAAQSAENFFQALRRRVAATEEGRVAVERDVFTGELQRQYHELDSALEGVAALANTTATRVTNAPQAKTRALTENLKGCERRAEQLREALATIVDARSGRVVWLEVVARRLVLSSTPVDLSVLLRERVFEQIPTAVLTSATLATGDVKSEKGAFSYVRARLGLNDEISRLDELVVESPFDFAKQAIFYAPRDLPPPGTNAFWDAACVRVSSLIALTGGGCFVLTTSLRAMRELAARLAGCVGPLPLLIQGQAPKATLVARFRAAGNAVLVATSGFWEGVDVPGNALRLVVLEKIPFAVPTDPIISARSLSLEQAGENAFMKLHVPGAAIALKQGFGRLIRTQRDVGIVALLDERIHRKGYGKKLLSALPPATQTSRFEDVERFWLDQVRGEGAP